PEPLCQGLFLPAGRRRGQGGNDLWRNGRVRHQHRVRAVPCPRLSRDHPAPHGHRSQETYIPLRRPRFPADGRAWEGDEEDFGLGCARTQALPLQSSVSEPYAVAMSTVTRVSVSSAGLGPAALEPEHDRSSFWIPPKASTFVGFRDWATSDQFPENV